IAFRYLKSRKNSGFAYVVTWFSFVGIALGVSTLIIVTSVMNGFRAELLDKIVGMKGHIVVSDVEHKGISDYDNIAKQIEKIDRRIQKVIPQIEQQGIVMANGQTRGTLIQALSQQSLIQKKLISENIKTGKISDFQNQSIFIGRRMAEILGLKLGDTLELMIPDNEISAIGTTVKGETYTIGGIFEVGMNEYDKNIILMPLNEAQDFWEMPKKVSQIEIFIDTVDNSYEITQKIAQSLGSGYMVLDWKHSDSSIFHAVEVEKNVMTLILSIIILVAVFNIISGLTMLTSSKIKDIAILRTMGMTKQSIIKIFFIIGSSIGLFGTTCGISLGLVVSLNIDRIKQFLEKFSDSKLFNEEIYFLTQIPSKTDWMEVSCISAFAIILCLLATIYPAIKASKLDPVESLRA
ncbi:MAG: lipoprotein-releasing ABC transporter permease subunit, partial [Alphaproteobacteria bacterium]|nr:lipoprotein-releasing ABC transporter permease subunit [Alphaproteobacteria bacterium]